MPGLRKERKNIRWVIVTIKFTLYHHLLKMAAYKNQINKWNPEIVGLGNDGEPLRNLPNKSRNSSQTKKCSQSKKNSRKKKRDWSLPSSGSSTSDLDSKNDQETYVNERFQITWRPDRHKWSLPIDKTNYTNRKFEVYIPYVDVKEISL